MRLSLLIAVCAVLASSATLAAEKQPNVVFIIADDLGWADVAFHDGNAPTPHLDKLAASGLELTQHYVAPVCSPTRAALLTGRCWSRFGVANPRNERALPWKTVTLPKALQAAGYDTCLTGKWHLGSKSDWGPNHYGFDHSYGSLAGGVGPWDHAYKIGQYSTTWHRNEKLITEEGHVTDLIAREAVDWIGQRSDKPYFLYVPFTAVHLPLKEPAEWLKRVPSEIEGEVPRQYAACIMHLDDAVGQIVAAVDKSGQRDNTLIVFTSDNGGSNSPNAGQKYPPDDYPKGKIPGNNAPLRGIKGDLYEGGIRVPTIANWPGKLPAGQCTAAVQIIDWMPTLCALAGATPKADLNWDGIDIWPTMTSNAALPPRSLYWTAPGFRARAVRHGDWKLIEYGNFKGKTAASRAAAKPTRVELFNLARDPKETTDLASQLPEKVADLQKKLGQVAQADFDAVAND